MKVKTEDSKEGMKRKANYIRTVFTLILGVAFLSGVAVFASKGSETLLSYLRPTVEINLTGSVERKEGKVELSKAGAVSPGEILEWKIVSKNNGDGEAASYKAVGQIPQGTEYVAGSANAKGSPEVKYSIDGGKSYSKKPMIKERQADGTEKEVPAPAGMYTQVRFEWSKSLAPGQELNAYYSTRVK